jgi:hypothetical protein
MAADIYFRSVAIDAFAEKLERLDARPVGDDPWAVCFENDRWFVEVIVFREERPKYCPRVHIGPLPLRSPDPARNRFDILHTLPDDSPLRRYNLLWRFADEVEMRAAYTRVLQEIFEPFVVDILDHAGRLEELLRCRTEEIDREWHAEIRRHNASVSKARAHELLDAGDHRGYLSEIERVPIDLLTPAEQARIEYIRKKRTAR